MIKVVHFGHVPLPAEHPEASRIKAIPGNWVWNLAAAQQRTGEMDPVIVSPVTGASSEYEAELGGIRVCFVPVPARWRTPTFFRIERQRLVRRALACRPDVVHGHGTEAANSLAAQDCGRPCVLTAQGLWIMQMPVLKLPLFSSRRLVAWMEQRTLWRARHVIAVSENVSEALHRAFPRLILHRIPLTFDPALLKISEVREPCSLVYVGSIHPVKGLDLLAAALPRIRENFPELSVRVVGNASQPSEYESGVLSEMRRHLGDRLVLHGVVPALEAARWMARATALVAPSRSEMFGNQLIESLLVGTHVLASENTALAENIRRFGNGTLFRWNDATDLAEKAVAVLQRTEGPEPSSAREKVCRALDPERVARAHLEVYRQVLRG